MQFLITVAIALINKISMVMNIFSYLIMDDNSIFIFLAVKINFNFRYIILVFDIIKNIIILINFFY